MDTQNQVKTPVAKSNPDRHLQERRTVQLPISRSLYRKFRQRARAERRSFTGWLLNLAERELRRKPSL